MALGFAVVALAFLLTDSKHPPTSAVDITLWVVALGGASSAACSRTLALKVSAWPWFSDAIWLPEPTWLQNAKHLQAHYVDYQHRTLSHLQPLNERKAQTSSAAKGRLHLQRAH